MTYREWEQCARGRGFVSIDLQAAFIIVYTRLLRRLKSVLGMLTKNFTGSYSSVYLNEDDCDRKYLTDRASYRLSSEQSLFSCSAFLCPEHSFCDSK